MAVANRTDQPPEERLKTRIAPPNFIRKMKTEIDGPPQSGQATVSAPPPWWFEDRGPQCTLLVYVDDATSRLMHLKLVETESTFDYFQATREYLEAGGRRSQARKR